MLVQTKIQQILFPEGAARVNCLRHGCRDQHGCKTEKIGQNSRTL